MVLSGRTEPDTETRACAGPALPPSPTITRRPRRNRKPPGTCTTHHAGGAGVYKSRARPCPAASLPAAAWPVPCSRLHRWLGPRQGASRCARPAPQPASVRLAVYIMRAAGSPDGRVLSC
eukprot:scaffold1834_cov331-Prasinococcus_capsulatus_cf.AAC.5